MSLPAGVTTATVTAGVPVTHTGAAVKTYVSIEPSVFLVHAATGTPLVDFLEELNISEGVAGSFVLPHTDQTGFQDENGNAYTNWYYTARVTYSTPSKAKNKTPKVKVFQLTTGQVTVDLDLLPSGAPALPYIAPTATVTSVNGLTGAITLVPEVEDAPVAALVTDPESDTHAALNSTYAPGAVPSTVTGTHTGGYDRRTNLYNIKPKHTRRLRAALAHAFAGTGLARIGTVGDSIMGGRSIANIGRDTWPARLRDLLVATGLPNAGTGNVYAHNWDTMDSRYALAGSWYEYADTHLYATGAIGDVMTFTSDKPGTIVEILYSNAGGTGTAFNVSIDGGAAIPLTRSGDGNIGTWTATGLADTTHVVQITSAQAGPTIAGVGVRRASGFVVDNGGISGSMASHWAATPFYYPSGTIKALEPDAVLIALYTNEGVNAVSTATYKANMIATIARFPGSDVILIADPPIGAMNLEPYRTVLYEIADQLDLPLVDLYDRWGSYENAFDMGLMGEGDWVHPNAAGDADIARGVFPALA